MSGGLSFGKALTKNYRIVYFLIALGFVILFFAIIAAIASPSQPKVVKVTSPGVATGGSTVVAAPSSTPAENEEADIETAERNAELQQMVSDQQSEIESLRSSLANRSLGQGSSASMYGSQ